MLCLVTQAPRPTARLSLRASIPILVPGHQPNARTRYARHTVLLHHVQARGPCLDNDHQITVFNYYFANRVILPKRMQCTVCKQTVLVNPVSVGYIRIVVCHKYLTLWDSRLI